MSDLKISKIKNIAHWTKKRGYKHFKSDQYRYRIVRKKYNSECEVCQKFCSLIYFQVEMKKYEGGYTTYECKSLYGHEKCLQGVRR